MPKSKSVAIVLANGIAGKGGIERSTLYLCRQVAKDAADISLIVQTSRWAVLGPVKHVTVLAGFAQFLGRLALHRVAVAHINVAPRASTFRKIVFSTAARWAGAKVILHLHGGGFEPFYDRLPRFAARATRSMFRKAHTVIILGEHSRAFVTARLGVESQRIVVVENGVPEPARRADPTHEVPLIVMLGRLGPLKGVDILLDALALLKARGSRFRALIGGNGDLDTYRRAANEAGIGDLVEFPGWLGEGDVAELLARADVFVLPSLVENQPISILEAMACGLPVVASEVGSIPSQVVDGETGFLVPPGEVEPLGAALEKLCRAPDLRRDMGARGFDRWRDHFSLETASAKIIAVYRRATAG
ncbi:glycosyltransferase family 4 protein [Sphingosinicella ginsenosidimutans]|uniref:Glycosyltransferase family 4 protein n=1 Tax=Allosphingosinicella ginsenosidimutans TaxID=1176539 RepID=A0A5C6TUM2_9SPHN|nr:glycosyltransferase family 4 protein [Sphingosinicella ginsenosidimutans]TXC63388.1 glycosyltransferase family 4 protein [Sphingosinicella ginsenosidimutans]